MAKDEAPERHHFKIGEVAEIVGVRPHVLRYWEQEFPALRPKKTRGSHRHYSRQNLELAQQIRALVVDEGYSVAGARKRLGEGRVTTVAVAAPVETDPRRGLREDLLAVRWDLVALLDLLDGGEPEPFEAHDSAAPTSEEGDAEGPVHAVVSASRRTRA